jgi:hypothetical protein
MEAGPLSGTELLIESRRQPSQVAASSAAAAAAVATSGCAGWRGHSRVLQRCQWPQLGRRCPAPAASESHLSPTFSMQAQTSPARRCASPFHLDPCTLLFFHSQLEVHSKTRC